MKFISRWLNKNEKVLVISGGGVRGFYALGILKAIEELGMKSSIKEVYGISAGAILGAYWCAGYTADEIYQKFITIKLFGRDMINFFPKKSLLSSNTLHQQFTNDLPARFDSLTIPLHIGTTDIKKAKFLMLQEGDLILPLLASMSIPCVFPPVVYKEYLLVDGGLTNNFPVDIAKKDHPHNKVIGINLNKFVENQEISTIIDGLSLTYEVLLRAGSLQKLDEVDYLFYRDLDIKVLDKNKKKMARIYEQGYVDAVKMFG